MIGDGLNDVQAGRAAGCRTILVTRLKVEQIQRFLGLKGATPDAVVPDLAAALRVVRQGGAP
jgi:phosphoglycolate phosphatase-like HAD superfamily hydrolase